MKKLLFSAVAGLALAAPLVFVTASAQPQRGDYRQDAPQAQGQRGDYRQDGPQAQRGANVAVDVEVRRDGDRDNRNRHRSWRDNRQDSRWSNNQHNGYYQGNRWHYGPPPQAHFGPGYDRNRVTLGYRPWRKGEYLGYYNGRYQEVDYRSNQLRRPPRGYHWVRNDGGDYLLAAVAGGLIAQVILNSGR